MHLKWASPSQQQRHASPKNHNVIDLCEIIPYPLQMWWNQLWQIFWYQISDYDRRHFQLSSPLFFFLLSLSLLFLFSCWFFYSNVSFLALLHRTYINKELHQVLSINWLSPGGILTINERAEGRAERGGRRDGKELETFWLDRVVC